MSYYQNIYSLDSECQNFGFIPSNKIGNKPSQSPLNEDIHSATHSYVPRPSIEQGKSLSIYLLLFIDVTFDPNSQCYTTSRHSFSFLLFLDSMQASHLSATLSPSTHHIHEATRKSPTGWHFQNTGSIDLASYSSSYPQDYYFSKFSHSNKH